MYNARLLATVAAGSLLACSFATSFDELEGAEPSPPEIEKDAADDTAPTGNALPDADAASDSDGNTTISEYLPEEGDYAFAASGTESIAVANLFAGSSTGNRVENGAFTARVRHTDSTHWTLSAAFSNQHTDEYAFAAVNHTLREVSAAQFTAWDLPNPNLNKIELTIGWTCDPTNPLLDRASDGGALPSNQVCVGRTLNKDVAFQDFTLTGTYSFVGEELLEINGNQVSTQHFFQSRLATGPGISGDAPVSRLNVDWYFRKSDGFPVKLVRTTVLRQWLVGVTADTRESVTWVLTSITPKPLSIDAGSDAAADASSDSGIKDAAKGQ